MTVDKVTFGTDAFRIINQFIIGVDKDVNSFARALFGFLENRLWETGWVKESTGEFQHATSFKEFLEKYLGTDIPWVYSKLSLAAPLDQSKNRYIQKAFTEFQKVVKAETGETAKALYEAKAGPLVEKAKEQATAVKASEVPKAAPHRRPTKVEQEEKDKDKPYTNNDISFNSYGTGADYRLRKLKRDAPEVAARVETGEFKTVADAERAAGIKPPKRDTKSPAYLLTYCRERLGADSVETALAELARAAGFEVVKIGQATESD